MGHETPLSMFVPSTFATVHTVAPPTVFVYVTALPLPSASTATHRLMLGQDTLASSLLPSTFSTDQAAELPVGWLDMTALP